MNTKETPDSTLTENTQKRSGKKSEMLEVRLPYEDKRAFMIACEKTGETASAVIRRAVALYTENRTFKDKSKSYNMIVIGFLAGTLATTGLVLTLPNHQKTPDHFINAYFNKLDNNDDNQIELSEYITPSLFLTHKQIQNTHNNFYHSGLLYIETNAITIYDDAIGSITIQDEIPNTPLKARFHEVNDNDSIQVPLLENCMIALANMETLLQGLTFQTLDQNDDQYLSLDEFSKSKFLPTFDMVKAEFRKLDINQNNQLEYNEISTYAGSITPQNHNTQNTQKLTIPPTCNNNFHKNGTLYLSRLSIDFHKSQTSASPANSMFLEMDLNNNGRITLNEFTGYFLPK